VGKTSIIRVGQGEEEGRGDGEGIERRLRDEVEPKKERIW